METPHDDSRQLALLVKELQEALALERKRSATLTDELDGLRRALSYEGSRERTQGDITSNDTTLGDGGGGRSQQRDCRKREPDDVLAGAMEEVAKDKEREKTEEGNDDEEEREMVSVSRSTLELLRLKERAIDTVAEGITIADAARPDMPLIYVNKAFQKMTGYPVEDVIGKNCRFLQGPGTRAEEVARLRECIKNARPCVTQITNYKRSGDPFVNYLSLTPVISSTGQLTHYVGVQSDITEIVEQRRSELAARHAAAQAAAATEAKSNFLARMSHEIRTPLNGIISVGQLLAETSLTPQQYDLVSTIRASGENLLALITDILDFSKIEANKMELSKARFCLESAIETAMEIAGLHAAQKRLHVAFHIDSNVPRWVIGDAQRLQQILLNLLNNAIKFTDKGEVLLEVWVENNDDERGAAQHPSHPFSSSSSSQPYTASSALAMVDSRTTTTPSPCEIHFSVRDTGIGIKDADLSRLFQSFSQVDASPTRRFGGSGLGLTISRKLAEAMGGRMWVESDGLGKGSTFRWFIRVPSGRNGRTSGKTSRPRKASCASEDGTEVHKQKSAANSEFDDTTKQQPTASPRPSGAGSGESNEKRNGGKEKDGGVMVDRRVLLVETCQVVRETMELALREWGCRVCTAGSEAEAIKALHILPEVDGMEFGRIMRAAEENDMRSSSSSILSLRAAASSSIRDRLSNDTKGPFDVVILDVGHSALLHALMNAASPDEACRVVFLGWPGQKDPEEEDEMYPRSMKSSDEEIEAGWVPSKQLPLSAPEVVPGSCRPSPSGEPLPSSHMCSCLNAPSNSAAIAPKAVTNGSALKRGLRRRLGYSVVTRPVRQGRLLLGLEEVLNLNMSEMSAMSNGEPRESVRQCHREEVMNGTRETSGAGLEAHRLNKDAPPKEANATVRTSREATRNSMDMWNYDNESEATRSRLGSSSTGSLLHASVRSRRVPSSSASESTRSGGLEGDSSNSLTVLRRRNAGRRLLLAEDNIINMRVALGILKRLGFVHIDTVKDGVEAVEAVAIAGGPAAYHGLLIDLHMPRKGGIEAVQDILKGWPDQKTNIIAVTADAFEDTRDTCMENGFTGWLAKPFRIEEFAKAMQ